MLGLVGLSTLNNSYAQDSFKVPVTAYVIPECKFEALSFYAGYRPQLEFGLINPASNEKVISEVNGGVRCTNGTQSHVSVISEDGSQVESYGNDWSGFFYMDARGIGHPEDKLRYKVSITGGEIIGSGLRVVSPFKVIGEVLPLDYKLAKITGSQTQFVNTLYLVLTP